jgi:hypothetical protein
MDCEEFLEDYSDYFDWRLEERPVQEYREHLSSCDACTEYDRVMRNGLHLVKDLGAPEPVDDCLSRVQQRVHALDRQLVHGMGRLRFAVAVAGVTAVTVMFITSLPFFRPGESVELPPVVVEIHPSTDEVPSVFGPAPKLAPPASLLRVPSLATEGLLATPPEQIPLFRTPLRTTAVQARVSDEAVAR